jgi:signal transduction histidine kinase
VLLIYQQQAETQPMLEFSQPLRETLENELEGSVEFYQEALDLDRFSGRERSFPLVRYFEEKYRRFPIDVVVPVGGRALRFAIDRLRPILPDVPIVFALCAEPQTDPASLPENVTGRIASASRFEPTLWMARRLQPDAQRVVVIGGAGPNDSASVRAALSALAPLRDSLAIDVLQGMSLDALLPRLRQLEHRSIVIFANYRQDGHGLVFEPLDVVGSIARAASAPMYAQLQTYIGEGVLGGSVLRFDDEGRRTGGLVARVVRLRPGQRIPAVERVAKSFVADWRQLRRFGLSESRLPPGTEVLYREPTAWQRHRTVVLPTLGIIVAELFLIGTLLVERRRRKVAQKAADEQQLRADETRRQVTHMGRVALLGELATTISHELRQPLAAIRANADTGAKLVRRRGGTLTEDDRELCDEIFRAIADDDALASDIISRVRSLVRREELPQQLVDLNEVCQTSARLLRYEALTRRADITLSLDPHLPAVIGDPIQFQQIVLNLVLNALEASAACIDPRVEISTTAGDDEVEIEVRDNGPGLPEDVLRRLFESFFTTKSQGLGLGLAIVHSIAERHHGRVQAENGPRGGAIFRVVVPRAQAKADRISGARSMHREAETSMLR